VPSDAEPFPSRDAWVEDGGTVRLVASRCATCGKHAFPPAALCDVCGRSDALGPATVGGVGTLYSFAEIHVAPAGFSTPYVIGYVDFPEDVRVLGHIEHPARDLHLGDRLAVGLGVIRRTPAGRAVVSYTFHKEGDASHA
jgi:uncharacterized OB-fold protein